MTGAIIFIVEDELIEAEDLKMTLERQGYTVAGIASSGETALSALDAARPDLVMMDIHLAGGMDGIETAEQVRCRYGTPVVFLTAFADDASLERAKVTEPSGYILKPYYERELHSVIEMALYKHRMEMLAAEHARTIRILANAIPDAVAIVDRTRQIVALNDAMSRRLGYDTSRTPDAAAMRPGGTFAFEPLTAQIDEAIGTGRPVRFEEQSGGEWFECTLHPVTASDPADAWVLVHYHDISDHKRFEAEIKREGMTRIEQNMEQFQILNDQIRNPLQVIRGYVNLDNPEHHDRIMDQIDVIDDLVNRLDQGWVESEKVRQFLMRHYQGHSRDPDRPE
jgi:two-component system, response regulator PdtaR